MGVAKFEVEVVCALPARQWVVALDVPAGATLRHALERSRIFEQLPGLVLGDCRFGVHGQMRSLDSALKAGDRIEIYRPLPDDPKAIRRRRALRQKED